MQCLHCGTPLDERARFCPNCGRPVEAEAATVAAVGNVTVRTPGSGWLSSSDSISHGRFPPGTILDSRYRIIGLLGRGGMGEVYRADDLRLGQPVALKFLPESLRRDGARLAQFHNEVRTARQVSHPNVCRVHDIGEVDGLHYLSMEYVDGEDLATSLRRIGHLPEAKALEITRQLCAGIYAAHQRGVIHRDLKPANVMLDGAGNVRIMDFGLAAIGAVDDVRVGTPAYMAPEQLTGRAVTARSDIFSLGLVLYELFTGKRAFNATTIADLVNQHEAQTLIPPSALVPALDPATERTIMRCLDPVPERRPASAFAVAASLPGGDPLAAALAAGETPSPEMVAAAGQGAGLRPGVAWLAFGGVLAVLIAGFVLAVRQSPLERMRPQYSAEILAEKAREALRQIGYEEAPRDEAYGFDWDAVLVSHASEGPSPSASRDAVLTGRPSPLRFWYRRSSDTMMAATFHTDLLTPGIVTQDDPAPIMSGMTQVTLDQRGRLIGLEAVPPQRQAVASQPVAVNWLPLFALAGLDASQLQPTDPLWNWLAASDTRAAWTGAWPGSARPLRVEGAALGGRPVAFRLIGSWEEPSRMTDSWQGSQLPAIIVLGLAIVVLVGAALLARRNLQLGRGDRKGATRLAVAMAGVLMALWIARVHFVASFEPLVLFLLAVATSTFYGVLIWTIYMALEPFVRRHWPQVLVSWTNVSTGNVRDPVVGRDILVGGAVAMMWVLIIRASALWTAGNAATTIPGEIDPLNGFRPTVALVIEMAPYALRNGWAFFLLLYMLRGLVRRQWAAAVLFAGIFAGLGALGSDQPVVDALVAFIYFGTGAFAVLRWGLLAYVVAVFIAQLTLDVPVVLDASAWYFGNVLFMVAVVVGLMGWGLYASVGRGAITRPPSLAAAKR